MPDVEIRLYSVADLRDYLIDNKPVAGLNECLISTARAYAILNNPYVEDNDHVVCAIFEHGTLAAYTAAFADMVSDHKVWWFTTLWCHPEYRGKGYGLIAIGSLAEEYGEGNFFDMWGAKETVEIFRYLGLKEKYFPEYHLWRNAIRGQGVRGYAGYLIRQLKLIYGRVSNVKARPSSYDVVKCTSFIDNETYAFMRRHSKDYLFFRSREMFNWILSHHFVFANPLSDKTTVQNVFSGEEREYVLMAVKVLVKGEIKGVFIFRQNAREFAIKYIYYDHDWSDVVFRAIVDMSEYYKKEQFSTRDRNLFQYVRSKYIYSLENEEQISFSCPGTFESDGNSQAGDGDGWV